MHKQLGLSLIEVMVSVIILGLGLLGLAALQARSVAMNQSAYYRSIAVDLAADLGDRIRVNRSPFLASSDAESGMPLPPDFSLCVQNTSNNDAVDCADQGGKQPYMVASEMASWNQYLRSQLPGATYVLVSAPAQSADYYRYTLSISWLDNRSKTTAVDGLSSTYTTVIE
ncbi:type IV pilus modification protein PilV [Deefgea sp. CFH1-16]|uniref:type IV pilus modification protein PilV n=1 Tax=Deefgea sp. CFH1-16 TaxID=2675457 RepID=UPI0015F388BE|nr:type IV pilus modification protein PilV [Deefgea sp. CFH1-16]